MNAIRMYCVVNACLLVACGGSDGPSANENQRVDPTPAVELRIEPAAIAGAADVVAVEVSGSAGSYSFAVTVSSRETGCDQFADWWEVLNEEGELLYRRVLLHSHVGEQPFVRSGGPVAIAADQTVWVRAHMNTVGYGGKAQRGNVADGFANGVLAADFAAGVAEQNPLPHGCDF